MHVVIHMGDNALHHYALLLWIMLSWIIWMHALCYLQITIFMITELINNDVSMYRLTDKEFLGIKI